MQAGNPNLQPESLTETAIEYSLQIRNQHLSGRLFYSNTTDAIHTLTQMNDEHIFLTQYHNLGDLHHYGIQLSGTFSHGKWFGFNPFLKLFHSYSKPGKLAAENHVSARNTSSFDIGMSLFSTFGKGVTASVIYQYSSPLNQIQQNYFSHALYFVSLEKLFVNRWKAGITSALPFAGKFIYRGYEQINPGFSSRSEGIIDLSTVPVMLKLTYQFESGKKQPRNIRTREIPETHSSKGF
jgi:hypothetical protein